jgi:hypothetical protein
MGLDQDDKARSGRIDKQRAASDRFEDKFATKSGK